MSESPFATLTEGRIVHYVLPNWSRNAGEHRPAIVTKVLDRDEGRVNLVVFQGELEDASDGNGPQEPTSVSFLAGGVGYNLDGARGTWHWPERVG